MTYHENLSIHMSSSKRKKILFISRYVPSLKGGGNEQRVGIILESLAVVGDVHHFVHDFDQPADRHIILDAAFAHFVNTIGRAATLASESRNLWRSQVSPSMVEKIFSLAWVTTGRVIPVSPEQTAALIRAIRRQTGEQRFDIIFAVQAHCAMLVTDALPLLLEVGGQSYLDWDAAEAPAMQEITQQTPFWISPTRYLRGLWNTRKLAAYEQRLLDAWDVALCASAVDVNYFMSRVPLKVVYALPNAVAIPVATDENVHSVSGAPQVVFVASMSYGPNNQGAILFLKKIWPAVRSAVKDAQIKFVGRGPSSALRSYHGRDGVVIVGEVDSVAPYYLAADVAIAPMVFSVGSAIKILEALAYRKPIVGYELSTRRHGLVDGRHVAVAFTTHEFSEKLIELLRNPAIRDAIGNCGYEFVKTNFSRNIITDKLSVLIKNNIGDDNLYRNQ